MRITLFVLNWVALVIAGVLAAAHLAAAPCAALEFDGWSPKFYPGLEADGKVSFDPTGFRGGMPSITLTWTSGMPFSGDVSLGDADGSVKAVYELSRGGETRFERRGGRIVVPVEYSTNDGRLFAFLPERIASVKVDAPDDVSAGETVRVTLSVLSAAGRPVNALLPAEIRLLDAAGRELDGAGWACLQGGVCTMDILTNLDDAVGDYRLVCRDRASGLSTERSIRRR